MKQNKSANISRDFLKRKLDEYEILKMEIEELKREVGHDGQGKR